MCDRAPRRARVERQPVERRAQIDGNDVRSRVDGVGHGAGSDARQLRAATIVEVHHRDRLLRQQLEEAPLGGEVVVHVAVEVEVIAREIREDPGGEAQIVDAFQRQRVRRHFHHAGAAALIHHLAEHRLQLRSLGSRALRLDFLAADAVADGANPAALDAGGLENRGEQIRRGRLAVGAGEADEDQPLARIFIEDRGQRRERETRIGHLHPHRRDVGRSRRLGQRRNRAAADGFARERGAVGVHAAQRHEDRARTRLARVVGDRRHRRADRRLQRRHGNAGPIGKLLQQDAERHCGRPLPA